MLFFKAEGRIENKDWQKTFDSKDAMYEVVEEVKNNVDFFNKERDDCFFVEEISKYKISLAVVAYDEKNIEKIIKQLLECLNFEVKNLTIEEISINDIVALFESARRAKLMSHTQNIMKILVKS